MLISYYQRLYFGIRWKGRKNVKTKRLSMLLDIEYLSIILDFNIHMKSIECAKFRGSRAIVVLMGLMPSCHRAFVGISWVWNFFSWIFRGSKIFSRGFFVGLKFFLVGTSSVQNFPRGYLWVQNFFVGILGPNFFWWVFPGSNYFFWWLISWFKDFQLLAALARVTKTEMKKCTSTHVFFSKSISTMFNCLY